MLCAAFSREDQWCNVPRHKGNNHHTTCSKPKVQQIGSLSKPEIHQHEVEVHCRNDNLCLHKRPSRIHWNTKSTTLQVDEILDWGHYNIRKICRIEGIFRVMKYCSIVYMYLPKRRFMKRHSVHFRFETDQARFRFLARPQFTFWAVQ